MNFEKGLNLGNWELIKKLGEGGNSYVWEAVNGCTGRKCALKLPKFRFDKSRKIYKIDKYKLLRFKNEIEIQERISELKIPGILPVIDYNLPKKIFKESFIYSMEEYPWLAVPIAKSLKSMLKNESFEKIITYFIQIAETLEKLHRRNIVHRDIKPENLLYYNKKPCLSDFGIAKSLHKEQKDLTKTGKKIGPNFFIAPEMRRGKFEGLDQKKADIYSFGATLWAFLTQEWTGFEGEYSTESLSIQKYISNSENILYEPIDDIIKRCTYYNPDKRPNISEVVERLKEWKDLNEEFIRNKWVSKVKNMIPRYSPVKNITWSDEKVIIPILQELVHLNHILFPFGGGLDMTAVDYSQEKGMIDVNCGGLIYRLKVDSLTLEYLEKFPEWSYFLLKISEVEPFDKRFKGRYEEPLTEIKPGLYSDYECGEWNNFDGKDLPESAKQIVRILKGKIAVFCKSNDYAQGNIRNLDSYKACHEKIAGDKFREIICKIASYIENYPNAPDLGEKCYSGIDYKFIQNEEEKEGRKLTNREIEIIKQILSLLKEIKDKKPGVNELVLSADSIHETLEKFTYYILEKEEKEKPLKEFLESLNREELILVEAVMYGGRDYFLYKNNHPLESYINYLKQNINGSITISNILSKDHNALISYFKSGLEAFS
ncbi:serine/threonine protein kinase [Persephonella atlantica]|uniref:Serine/threonine protein kinase n=1 Tax=Persephonella atlantica TaxID=2699429 RepID=A0ABS1GKH5_9AQUI|nr:serine/threonine-protein kinase [Persephonella atlantica]MBK3333416.1 serine/threonine protein kinase [Persephonella atlantica]